MNNFPKQLWRVFLVSIPIIFIISFLALLVWTPGVFSLEEEAGATTAVFSQLPPDPAPDLPEGDNEPTSARQPNAAQAITAVGGNIWAAQGPGPADNGQIENVSPNDEVSGAIHTVVAHPTDPDILYAGGTNGGLWKTTNASATSPHWEPLSDQQASLSIGALAFDPMDATGNTLVAGNGRYSSFSRQGGERLGLLHTTDGGATWTALDGGGTLIGKNISGVAPRGNVIVISVNTADIFSCSNIGIFRSTDSGVTFSQVTNGIPQGVAYDLVVDPNNSNILYTNIVFGNCSVGGVNGFYKSIDGGASWVKVSNATMDALIIDSTTSNMELSVGMSNNVYASIINTGQLAGVFRSGNGGTTWTQLDTPLTNENGSDVGLNPRPKGPPPGAPMEEVAGGQGSIHSSIVADPANPNLVYMGGDRQPNPAEYGGCCFPNSIGAFDYSGRLFRGDASLPANSQFAHLTHLNSVVPAAGGTASSSAPHADSREMVFTADGDLIEVDDGGIYRRTNPQNNSGDWFSINGDIQTTEMHDIAYDSVSNKLISGNQDTGTTYQTSAGGTNWNSLTTADGGDVAVDNITLAGSGQSIRYSSYQNLGAFRYTTWDAAGNLLAQNFPALNVVSGAALNPQFVTPIRLNAITPTRLLIGAGNGLYESTNQGNTLTQILTASPINSNLSGGHMMVYGGHRLGVAYPQVLYAPVGSTVYVRKATGGVVATTAAFPGSFVRGLAANPDDWMTAYAIDNSGRVYQTPDAGDSIWNNVTGNLNDPDLRSVVVLPQAVFVGGTKGVYVMFTNDPGVWYEFGENLPTVPVWDMVYDAVDDVLAVGTLGRGAWLVSDVTDLLVPDVSVQKEVMPETAVAGQTITYTLTFTNSNAPVMGVFITDTIPAEVSVTAIASTHVVTNVGTPPAYHWQLGDLGIAESGVITVTGVLTTAAVNNPVVNTAVIGGVGDTTPLNNSDQAALTVINPDVSVQKEVIPETAVAGQTITYTLTFTNSNAPITGVFITDTIPAEISVTAIASTHVVTNVGTPPAYHWQLGDLGIAENGVITVTGVLTQGIANISIINTAVIGGVGDITPLNNSDQAVVTVESAIKNVYLPVVTKP